MVALKTMADNSIDSVVTDGPYGIFFMKSKNKWDSDVPSVDLWKEVFRVLKPGGYVLSFSSTRTYHRMAVNIEDADTVTALREKFIYPTEAEGFDQVLLAADVLAVM